MKLSTVRVSHIFNTGAMHETDPEGEIERLLGEYFDEIVAKHCAAGEWRFDVENAPKDTPLQLWCKIHPANDGHDLRIGKLDSRSKTWTDGVWRLYVSAFAVPNPPQKPEIKS